MNGRDSQWKCIPRIRLADICFVFNIPGFCFPGCWRINRILLLMDSGVSRFSEFIPFLQLRSTCWDIFPFASRNLEKSSSVLDFYFVLIKIIILVQRAKIRENL